MGAVDGARGLASSIGAFGSGVHLQLLSAASGAVQGVDIGCGHRRPVEEGTSDTARLAKRRRSNAGEETGRGRAMRQQACVAADGDGWQARWRAWGCIGRMEERERREGA